MNWNSHSELEGRHAFLSASNPAWVNYDEDKLANAYLKHRAAARGTRRHNIARMLIEERIKLPEEGQTIQLYVNDCIGFNMRPEQMVYATRHAFGTADAISFRDHERILRISDLKTGEGKVAPTQLELYAAYWCLEYAEKPLDLEGIELRIYQNDDVAVYDADPIDITVLMDRTIAYSNYLDKLIKEALL